MNELDYFSAHYEQARNRFLQLAATKGAILYALPVNEKEGLFIDIAIWQGNKSDLIMHTSGLHGVEAFAGSAVQCAFIDALEKDQIKDKTLVLIHCMNPYGMQNLRRWNAKNIDLNRNFIDLLDKLPENPKYEKVSSILNPKNSHQLKGFYWKAFLLLMRYGFSTLQQAIAQGQYAYPKGIFYGGNALASETKLVLDFFTQHLISYQNVTGIDFHTGLGKYKQSSCFLESDFSMEDKAYMEDILQQNIIHVAPGKKQTYQTKGGFIARLKKLYEYQNFVMITQEIGTVGPIKIVKTLREENYYSQHAPEQRKEAAHRLKTAFCPEDDAWKKAAVREGVRTLFKLLHHFYGR